MGEERFGSDGTSREGSRNYIDFYVEKALAFGGHNVVNKNKILDMLLRSPRFVGRLQEERDDAVSDNPSFKRLNSSGKVHLSHNPLTHQNSSAKLLNRLKQNIIIDNKFEST